MPSSSPILNVYYSYILQYLHFDATRYLVHNIHGIVTCISFYEYVLSLKVVFIAETCF